MQESLLIQIKDESRKQAHLLNNIFSYTKRIHFNLIYSQVSEMFEKFASLDIKDPAFLADCGILREVLTDADFTCFTSESVMEVYKNYWSKWRTYKECTPCECACKCK